MSDGTVLVDSWESINAVSESEISGREKQRVASVFNDEEWDFVVWIPEWLLDDKDLETCESFYRLAVGVIDDYSEKAWMFAQPHKRDVSGCYLPKSQVVVFERLRGVESIDTPQRGLAEFERGEA